MRFFSRIPYLARFAAAFGCAMLGFVFSAPAAFAIRTVPNSGGPTEAVSKGANTALAHTVVASGMPVWLVMVIIAGVAVLVAAVATVVERGRAGHRTVALSVA